MAKNESKPAASPAQSGVAPIEPNYAQWREDYKGVVASLGGKEKAKPSSGVVGATAALRHVRAFLMQEVKDGDTSPEATFYRDTVKNAINARIKAIVAKGSVEDGWLSNASAAAKAAGFKTDGAEITQIEE